jgi:hypothetical protein
MYRDSEIKMAAKTGWKKHPITRYHRIELYVIAERHGHMNTSVFEICIL